MLNTEDFFTLLVQVFSDESPSHPDVIYLFAHTKGNEESVLKQGINLAKGTEAMIAICGGEGHEYPGYQAWKRFLLEQGIAESRIVGVPPLEPLHTYTEALGFVREAKKRGWKRAQVVSSPFHQLRAFLSMVRALKEEYPSLAIFNTVGIALPWYEKVIYNQSGLEMRRTDFMKQELVRIEKYTAQGDLATLAEGLRYLEARSVS